MIPGYVEHEPDRVAAQFLCEYHKIWQRHFPGLNKRAHWHVIFSARTGLKEGVSCRSIHRTLYGFYGTDIRTCNDTLAELCAAFGGLEHRHFPMLICDQATIAAIFNFLGAYDQKWRETSEL